MTWIKIPTPAEDKRLYPALMAVRAAFPESYSTSDSTVELPKAILSDSIVMSHALYPDIMQHVFTGFGLMMSEDHSLSRREHELIATVTSAANGCFY